jgi:hypothetical protein
MMENMGGVPGFLDMGSFLQIAEDMQVDTMP